jgi:hypothetical protein
VATAEFTAQFIPTPADVEAMFRAILRRNPTVVRIRVIVASCTALAGTAVGWLLFRNLFVAILVGLGAGALYWFTSHELEGRMARRGVAEFLAHPQSGSLWLPYTIELSSDGMRIVTGEKDVALPWSTFPRVESSADGMIVFKNAKEAVRIPRRAFPDETVWRSFVSYVTAHIHDARGAGA